MNNKGMRILLATVLLFGGLTLGGCKGSKAGAANSTQTAEVKRGNLKIDIVSGGNLALSKKEDLAFKVGGTISGVEVAVAEVLVEEGDSVKQGQVIARLNTAPLEDTLKTAERAVKSAEIDLKSAQDGQFKIKSAEYDLENATNTFNKLNYPYTYATFNLDIPAAIEALGQAQRQLDEAKAGIDAGSTSESYGDALAKFKEAQLNVAKAIERLARGQTIDTYSSENISRAITDYTAARTAQINMEKAKYTLEQTKTSVQATLDKATIALEKAQDDLGKAKEDLANAVITAPFDGFITALNVKGGDKIQKGTVAAQLADPAKFEVNIMVGERDIFQVKEGGTATIQIDAAPAIVLTAKVTQISPTGTVQSGVVNYKVKAEAESVQFAGQGQQVSSDSSQARPSSGSSGRSQPSPQAGGVSANVTSQLREGLSVTVNILVSEAKNVLLVPNGAITRSGREVEVQVMKGGVAEKRVVKTGISNWQYTVVTEGLAEGENVVISKATTTTTPTSTSSQQRPIFIPR